MLKEPLVSYIGFNIQDNIIRLYYLHYQLLLVIYINYYLQFNIG